MNGKKEIFFTPYVYISFTHVSSLTTQVAQDDGLLGGQLDSGSIFIHVCNGCIPSNIWKPNLSSLLVDTWTHTVNRAMAKGRMVV